MSFTFKFAARFFEDLQKGYNYYIERHAYSAAEHFLDDIQNTIDVIKSNPYIFSTRYLDVRCGIPKSFPYLIHYKIFEEQNEVLFIAATNTYQNPTWQ